MRRCFSRAVVRICRQWTGGKAGAPVAAALLAALLLLPALQPVLASPPRAARYEAYPAIGWQTLDAAELGRLDSTTRGSDAGGRPQRYQHEWVGRCGASVLTRLLPGVSFYNRGVLDIYSTAPAQYNAVALYNGRSYELRSLNKLLADVGYKFDTTEIPAVAKIAVLWTLTERQAGLHRSGRRLRGAPPPDSSALATAIPAVTFRKIGPSKVQLDGLPARTIEVQCEIDGEPVTFHLSLRSGKHPMRLHGFGRQLMFFDAPPLRRSAIGLTQWTIAVGGQAWQEADTQARIHYFLRAAENGASTGDSFLLTVVGPTSGKVYLHWVLLQDTAVEFWDSTNVQSCSARVTWKPTEAMTGEYELTAHAAVLDTPCSPPVILDPEAWRTGVLSPGNGS